MLAELNQLGAKIETTEGTFSAPGVGDKKFLVRNLKYKPVNPKGEREARSNFFSTHPHVGTAIGGELTFELDLYAEDQTNRPAWVNALLAACRWGVFTGGGGAAAHVINPISANNLITCPPLSMSCNVDGFEHRLAGCRGNCVFKLRTGKEIAAAFRFLGVHAAHVDTAMLSPTFDTNADDCPSFISAALALTGVSPATDALTAAEAVLEGLEIDLGNELFLRPDANAAFGYRSCQIVAGMPKVRLDPEWVAKTVFDYIENLRLDYLFSLTTGQLNGKAAKNNIKFDMPRVQFETVDPESRGGIRIAQIQGIGRGNAGNDELTITLST